MYLRELRINGFKSFADRTPLQLARGVTCIVGPNGCGKSNIVDAIRWVLGEQSAKALRGGKMQDVIFQGTDRRAALPSCEVSLTFADCERELGTAFNEVEVTRRVDREGGGDYFLNGKRCRLKDIQQLFMDTGIGRSGYSFMMQGQIDQILSNNPQERRTIFEEAAGITKYKAQRKEALAKLDLTEQNLARVTDVLEQMTRQLNTLRRQASKALRHQRLRHRLTHLDLAQLAWRFEQRQRAITEWQEKAAELRDIVATDQQTQATAEAALQEAKAQRATALEAAQLAQQAVFDRRSEKDAAENRLQFATVRRQDLSERLAAAERELSALAGQLEALAERRQSAEAARHSLTDKVSTAEADFAERQAAFDAIARHLLEADRTLNLQRQQLQAAEGTLARLRSQVTQAEVALRTYEVRHAALASSAHESRHQLTAVEERAESVLAAVTQREVDLSAAKHAMDTARGAVAEHRAAFRAQQATIAEADRDLARTTARLTTLEDMQARFEGFSAGAKAILQGKLADTLPPGIYQPLSAVIEADPRYTPALETLLGASAEAIVLDEAIDRVGPVLRALDARDLGRACLQVSVATRKIDLGGLAVPSWLVAATTVIKPKQPRNEEMAKLVAMFFEGCYFCDDLERFLDFWNRNYAFDFLFVATNHDELVSHRGLVYGGKRRTSESSFIQRGHQIRQLQREVAERHEGLTVLQERAMAQQEAIEAAEKALEFAQAHANDAARDHAAATADQRSTRQSIDALRKTLDSQQRELAQLEGSRSEAEGRFARTRAELTQAEQNVERIRQEVESHRGALAQRQVERDRWKDGLTEARLAVSAQRQQLELQARGVAEAETQRQSLQQRIAQRQREQVAMEAQRSKLAEDAAQDQQRLTELESELAEATADLAACRAKTETADRRIAELDRELAALRNAAGSRQQTLTQYQVRLAEESSQARFLTEKVSTEYERDVTQVRYVQQLWLAQNGPANQSDLDDLEGTEDDDGPSPQISRQSPTTSATRAPLAHSMQPASSTRKSPEPERAPTADDLRALEATDWKAVEAEVKDLRKRIASLGAINLVAVEEYTTLKAQHDFRKSQSEDIWRAKEELLKTIDEINATSQQLFAETFTTIRQNFAYTFEKLFGGGTGDLELITAEDVLDSGIDIIARPPGTKMRNLTLLSGGQRTMTALALLFAIYMVKPSPFAVLDELDAPLDDINVGRFTDIVREFVQYSQFLIVTHNKRTMAAADALFGVTMQERGVTKLFSMRFNSEKASV